MDMSKMGIIASSTKQPNVSVRGQRSEVLSLMGPTVQVALQCQRILRDVSLSVILRTYLLAFHIFLFGRFVTWHTLVAFKSVLFKTAIASHAAWNCKSMKRLRKKVEFEFFTFILGSSGNGLFCTMFWPGWWVFAFATLAIWLCVR